MKLPQIPILADDPALQLYLRDLSLVIQREMETRVIMKGLALQHLRMDDRGEGFEWVNNLTADSLEALGLISGDMLYATADNVLARLAKGTALQHLRMNSGATAPEWASYATIESLEGLSLVAGDTLYVTAADTLARLAKGTSGQSLTMNSGATAPGWEEPDFKFLASGSLTGANVDIVLTTYIAAGYTSFMLTVQEFQPATDNQQLMLRTSNNAGSSFAATNYQSIFHASDGATYSTAELTAYISLAGTVGNQAGEVANVKAFFRVSAARFFCESNGHLVTGTPNSFMWTQAAQSMQANTDAVQLAPASGNFNSGTYRLYGIRES